MIDWRDPDGKPRRGVTWLSAMRWGMATALVVVAHGAGAWAALNWHPIDTMPSDPPPAVMIELAPLAVAPPTPPQDVAPGPQMTEAQPETTPDAPTPIEDVKPDPTPPTPQPEEKIPELPKKESTEAVVAPPPPKPKPAKKPPTKKHERDHKKPIDPDKPKRRQTTAPIAQSHLADTAAAPSAGSSFSSSVSPATWKGELMAHLNRYKRYPSGATGSGTASVAFTISRSGQVLSSRLIRSSGDPALDAEAASLPRRASPVPAPPPNIGGGIVTLTVPIHFGR